MILRFITAAAVIAFILAVAFSSHGARAHPSCHWHGTVQHCHD